MMILGDEYEWPIVVPFEAGVPHKSFLVQEIKKWLCWIKKVASTTHNQIDNRYGLTCIKRPNRKKISIVASDSGSLMPVNV